MVTISFRHIARFTQFPNSETGRLSAKLNNALSIPKRYFPSTRLRNIRYRALTVSLINSAGDSFFLNRVNILRIKYAGKNIS